MGTITVGGKKIQISSVDSLLNGLLKAGISIPHKCGGKAHCGTCRIRIISGKETLSPIQPRERKRLEAASLTEEFRLACQAHTSGDVEIEIVSSKMDRDTPDKIVEKG